MSGRAMAKGGAWRTLMALVMGAAMVPACVVHGGTDAVLPESPSSHANPPDQAAGVIGASAAVDARPPGGRFLIVTDIHFDPFADPDVAPRLARAPVGRWHAILDSAASGEVSAYGSDSNWTLMESALNAAREAAPAYDFVLYAGDYLAHDFNADYQRYVGGDSVGLRDFVVKTVQFVGESLHRHFPEAPILGTLGNNDAICGDYMVAPESPLLAAIQEQWGRLAGDPDAFDEFHLGGFYTIPHPTVNDHDFVVLNSIFWSTRYVDQCGRPGTDPGNAQLAWLRWKLARARLEGRAVSILMHVPPGINAYSSRSGSVCSVAPTPFMAEQYSVPLLALLESYADILRDGFAGHTHMDSFRVNSSDDGTPFLATRITPAVSPIFGNNPAFAVVQYDRATAAQTDYQVHYLTNLTATGADDPPSWAVEYDFALTYHAAGFGPDQALDVARLIQVDSTRRADFIRYYASSTRGSSPVNTRNWKVFACAQTALTEQAFTECTCGG